MLLQIHNQIFKYKINNINKNKDYLITENLSSQNNIIKKEKVKNSHSIKKF